jgi:DNA-binding NarL/FixJ family response regulator
MKKPPRNTRKLGILLVDDHPLARTGVRHMIETEHDLMVCGEAGSAAEGLTAAINLSPTLVISDVSLPGRSGFEFVQDLAARCPEIPVLMLSMHSEFTYGRRALEIGARGYIMKSAEGGELLRAIRTVLRGSIYLSRACSEQMLEYMNGRSRKKRTGIEALTPREFEIFSLIGYGVSSMDIGERLKLSPKTVDTHRDRIKIKLGVDKLSELISISSSWLTEQSMTPPSNTATTP